MILRLCGSFLLLLASSIVSMMLSRVGKRRLLSLQEVINLLKYIRNNISSFKTPLDGIFNNYRSDLFDSVGFSDAMKSEGLCAAFSRSYLDIPSEVETHLIEFSCSLGTGYADDEIKRCDYYVSVIQEIAEKERTRVEKSRELYRFLPTLAALSVIIILL